MKRRRLLLRLLQGHHQNVPFEDFCELIQAFGFRPGRSQGSHQIFLHPACTEMLNLQPRHGEAKPYQIRQFLRLVERYNLRLEDER